MNWSCDRVERLLFLKGEGFSADEIAQRLGGVSRNAVCGKLDRLKNGGGDAH